MPRPRRSRRTAGAVVALAVVLALSALGSSAPAQGAAPERIVIVTVDGTTLEQWAKPGLSAFAKALDGAAVGLLSTRAGLGARVHPVTRRRAAYLSFGAGERTGSLLPGEQGAHRGLGRFGGALADARLAMTAIGGANGEDALDAPAPLAVMRPDGTMRIAPAERVEVAPLVTGRVEAPQVVTARTVADERFPTGRRTDRVALVRGVERALEWADVVVVDTGDTARVNRTFSPERGEKINEKARDSWMDRAMEAADLVLADVLAMMGPADLLVVASVLAPTERVHRGIYLGAVAMKGPGVRPGVLESETTRRRGLISLSDLAPTLLSVAGVPVRAGYEGRVAYTRPDPAALRTVLDFEEELVHAAAARRPLTRGMLGIGMLFALVALFTILAGRGRGAAGRIPFGWRDVIAFPLLAACAGPLALLVEPLAKAPTVGWGIAAAAIAAGGIALVARVALGREKGLGAILLVTAGVALGDIVLGGPLASRASLSFVPAAGLRFWGIGNEVMGVVIASGALGAGLLLDHARRPERWHPFALVGAAAAVGIMGAPTLGGKFGAPLTAIPAFGVVAARVAGRRIDRRVVLGIAIAVVLVSGALVLADALRSADTQGHVGAVVSGRTDTADLLLRKIGAAGRLVAFTIWSRAVVLFGGVIAILAWRRRQLLGRAFWGKPHTRAALWGCLAGAVVATGANDAGLVAAALIAMIAACGALVVMLSPE